MITPNNTNMFQFKLIVAVTLTLAACCAGSEEKQHYYGENDSSGYESAGGAPAGAVNGLANLLEANNFRPNNCVCRGSGFLLDTCTKPSGWFSSGTCKPRNHAHLQKWHKPCYVCNPDGSTRRRLAKNSNQHDYRNTMIRNAGNTFRRAAAIQRVIEEKTREMKRKPTALELAKFVKCEFRRSDIDGGFTTAEAFEYLKDFVPQAQQAGRRRLCKHTSWFGGDCANCKRNAEIVKKAEERRKRNEHWTPPKTDDERNFKLKQRLNKKL